MKRPFAFGFLALALAVGALVSGLGALAAAFALVALVDAAVEALEPADRRLVVHLARRRSARLLRGLSVAGRLLAARLTPRLASNTRVGRSRPPASGVARAGAPWGAG